MRRILVRSVVNEKKNDSEKSSSLEEKEKSSQPLRNYISRHGNHFTTELAEKVSSWMLPDDEHVVGIDDLSGITLPEGVTSGDMIFLSNYFYLLLRKSLAVKPKGCIRYALRCMEDSYPEMAFVHFLVDSEWRGMTNLDWEKFT